MSSNDKVTVWDQHERETTGQIDAWSTWDKVKAVKGFPGGLIAFLQTSTDHEGCGFPYPTIVQAYSWPILQSGSDLIGVAKTGSGKTLAFLLPGFIKLRKLKKHNEIDTQRGPALMVMTPTRELCFQIFSDTEKFGKPVEITCACAYGGANKRDQEWAIKQGPDCMIATPGRLNDFIESGSIYMDQVRFAVLDEADRMLDMGFEPQIRKILDRTPSHSRQTAMFTATWPKECQKLAAAYIKNPISVQIGADGITTNANIRQNIEVCADERSKTDAIKRICGNLGRDGNCLIFCNTKRKCHDLCWELGNDRRLGLKPCELHGDLDQRQRDESLANFRQGRARVMIATDVAARGLDIRNISIVINADVPNNGEDYVHRIGRTGRAEDVGDAYTLFSTWGDEKKASFVMEFMAKAGQQVPQLLKDVASGRARPGSATSELGGGNRSLNNRGGGNQNGDWSKGEMEAPGAMFNLLGKRAGGGHDDAPDAKRWQGGGVY